MLGHSSRSLPFTTETGASGGASASSSRTSARTIMSASMNQSQPSSFLASMVSTASFRALSTRVATTYWKMTFLTPNS